MCNIGKVSIEWIVIIVKKYIIIKKRDFLKKFKCYRIFIGPDFFLLYLSVQCRDTLNQNDYYQNIYARVDYFYIQTKDITEISHSKLINSYADYLYIL